ncbi:GTP-binding protein EngB [Liberibacter crescens BT-1]|uniref:Probable GTP-binding protein EngB n=1 Tax=Liberibacter crescens (strain BT-1) TaxID=1215343 RepID=L0EUT6_LIBCB|nr:ribosome biogenesis GTP-binding protein YihA/YsxC [Liberibacter crescens]AGA65314.1 GTP-binding protein EngB [Liberibacter crescens BT-1]AMC13244.1 GTP-binding protein [Liberibacter crescens]
MFIDSDIFLKKHWIFLKGVPEISLLPQSGPPEIAFIGRSNVGKSSLINALINQKGLARTSNVPGRTQELNYFIPSGYLENNNEFPPLAIVDMPGYGYMEAPKEKANVWKKLIFQYFYIRSTLKRVYLLIDSRHGIKKNDKDTFLLLDKAAISYQVILTKIDKIDKVSIQDILEKTQKAILKHPASYPFVLATSSGTGKGLEILRNAIIETVNT